MRSHLGGSLVRTDQINLALWIAFFVASVAVFMIGNMDTTLRHPEALIAAGSIDTLLAGTLLWRHGFSFVLPFVIAVYVVANKWFLFLLFLTAVFSRGG